MDKPLKNILPTDFEIIYGYQDETLLQVLEKLSVHKIQSVPYRENDPKTGQMVILRYIDTLDIIYFLIDQIQLHRNEGEGISVGKLLSVEKLSSLIHSNKSPLKEILSPCEPLFTLTPQNPIRDLFGLLGGGLHRVLVVEPSYGSSDLTHNVRVKALLTQSFCLKKLLDQNHFLLSPIAYKTCSELGFEKKVISMSINSVAVDVFIKMRDKGIGSLAIVDDEGKFVDVIKAKDLSIALKSFPFSGENPSVEFWSTVLQPIQEFLNSIHPTRTRKDKIERIKEVTAKPETKIYEIVENLVSQHLHQLYLIDKDWHPVGVVSGGDICRELIDSYEGKK